jgi:hypothetical protein
MLLQPNEGAGRRRNGRKRRALNEHFNLDFTEIDRKTYNRVKNVTESCNIPQSDLEISNQVCHNVFICQEEKCALPVMVKLITNLKK